MTQISITKPDSLQKKTGARVLRALEDDRYKWRTIRGIARSAHIKPENVEVILIEHQDDIVKSSLNSSRGEALYATRRHYKKNASLIEKIMAILRNRMA